MDSPSLSEAFESPELLIERGKDHIRSLSDRIPHLLSGADRWVGFTETDPENGDVVAKMRFKGKIPPVLSSIVNDAAYNLRAALDHSCYASAMCIRGGDPKNAKFPFGPTKQHFESELKRGVCKDLEPDIITLIRSFEPYSPGNPVLLALNQLRNRKGHRVLVPLGMLIGNHRVHIEGAIAGPQANLTLASGGAWDAGKKELTMARVAAGAQLIIDARYQVSVGLYGVPSLAGVPATDVLSAFAQEVERVIMAIKAETARLLDLI